MSIWKKDTRYRVNWSLEEIDKIKEKKRIAKVACEEINRRVYPAKWECSPVIFCTENPISLSGIRAAYDDYKMSEICY